MNNVNLMTLPGKTASRFLLAVARIVLTNEQFNNGYLPDFRGDKTGRVPIPQESVDKMKGASMFTSILLASYVRRLWQRLFE